MALIATFPFTAVVGHDDAKLALALVAVDPRIGGVLLRGQKGAAKTTLARGLAGLLPGDAPFTDLPLGATEDRLVGTIDVAAALTTGERRFEPGLLAAADGGVLYVDEVNLLADHLVDVLLDVAVSGVNRVEREGVSHEHVARFVLVGSMNPEEGELRPQLLDRFGLTVDIVSPTDPDERADAVARRLAFDADPVAFARRFDDDEAAWRDAIARARADGAVVPAPLLRSVSALCAAMAVDGLRADLVIARAAAAHAALGDRRDATPDDVAAVAHLALAHRQRRTPFDEHGLAAEQLEAALADAFDGEGAPPDTVAPAADPGRPVSVTAPPSRLPGASPGRRSVATGARGRFVTDRPHEPGDPVAVVASALATGERRRVDADAPAEVRGAVRTQRVGNLVVMAVDASGSMGAVERMETAKGALLGLLLDAYQRRDRVALVTFRGDGAEVVLRPTGAVEVARARLADLPTGGATPLAAGIDAALKVAATAASSSHHRPVLVLVTDGRATAGPVGVDPVDAAMAAAGRVRRQGVPAVVVDAEDGAGGPRLGLAPVLARAMGAACFGLASLQAGGLQGVLP